MNANDVIKFVKKHGVKMIDCKFVDFLGSGSTSPIPIERLDEGIRGGLRLRRLVDPRLRRRSTRPTC